MKDPRVGGGVQRRQRVLDDSSPGSSTTLLIESLSSSRLSRLKLTEELKARLFQAAPSGLQTRSYSNIIRTELDSTTSRNWFEKNSILPPILKPLFFFGEVEHPKIAAKLYGLADHSYTLYTVLLLFVTKHMRSLLKCCLHYVLWYFTERWTLKVMGNDASGGRVAFRLSRRQQCMDNSALTLLLPDCSI